MDTRRRRSPLRILAPVALIAFGADHLEREQEQRRRRHQRERRTEGAGPRHVDDQVEIAPPLVVVVE
jgi:hypothetical protein